MMTKPETGSCLVCQKHQEGADLWGGIIYQDELIFVSHAQLWGSEVDIYLGHLFIEPKRHVPGLADLYEDEARAIGYWSSLLAQSLRGVQGADHVYSFVLGHHVPHLHIHIIPRYPGAPREYWGVKVDEWPEAPRGDRKEVEVLSDRLRAFLQERHS